MGTWSHGNFDNDCSADFLSDITGKLVEEIRQAVKDPEKLEADEYWGDAMPSSIELLNLIATQNWVGTVLPETSEAKAWKATYLEVWDKSIEHLNPKEGYKEKRLSVLEDTFNRLIDFSKDI